MADLLVIVPTRGRPESVTRIIEAWDETDGWRAAELALVVDADDPDLGAYEDVFAEARARRERVRIDVAGAWRPLVPKLNTVARNWRSGHFALAFMGDDHLPRTSGWSTEMLAALRDMGTGVVYGDDLLQRENLCTAWAMTSDIVGAIGSMVPAPVGHMYCDNAVMELARGANCLRYLPDVVIEHCHPLAGKADWDDGYAHVNRPDQYRVDEAIYRRWLTAHAATDIQAVRELIPCSSP